MTVSCISEMEEMHGSKTNIYKPKTAGNLVVLQVNV